MSDLKTYKTKCLRVDLVGSKKNFVIKRFGSTRQKSLDKKVVKTRMIPHFPIRIGSTVNSNDSDEGSKVDVNYKLDLNSNEDQPYLLDSNDEVLLKTRRHTTECSSSTNNSSVLSKKAHFLGSKHLCPKEVERLDLNETDEISFNMPSAKIQLIPESLRTQAMPPSPANSSRMRSESLDPYIAFQSKRNLFGFKEPEEKPDDPSSVEFWLPCYETVNDDLLNPPKTDTFSNYMSSISNSTDDSKMDYDTILSNYNKLKRFMTTTQKQYQQAKRKYKLDTVKDSFHEFMQKDVQSDLCVPSLLENDKALSKSAGMLLRKSQGHSYRNSNIKKSNTKIRSSARKSATKYSLSKINVGKGALLVQNRNSLTNSNIKSSKVILDMVNDDEEDDEVGLECDDEQSPSKHITALNKSLMVSKIDHELEQTYLGYINSHYEFVFPKVDLNHSQSDEALNLDKLNIFKAFTVNNSRHNELSNKRVALDLVRKIISFEVDKYRDNCADVKLAKIVLYYDAIMTHGV